MTRVFWGRGGTEHDTDRRLSQFAFPGPAPTRGDPGGSPGSTTRETGERLFVSSWRDGTVQAFRNATIEELSRELRSIDPRHHLVVAV